MNLQWNCLTSSQRADLAVLGQEGLYRLRYEIGEQLYNLGLAEIPVEGLHCITATETTVLPTTIH